LNCYSDSDLDSDSLDSDSLGSDSLGSDSLGSDRENAIVLSGGEPADAVFPLVLLMCRHAHLLSNQQDLLPAR